MSEKLAVINASLGKYTDKDGKEHAKYQEVGTLFKHSDGRCFLRMNAYFDYGRLNVKEGNDSFFLEVRTEEGLRLVLRDKEEL